MSKNILIITAHPSSHNLTKGITQIYQDEKIKQKKMVEVIDLYSDRQLPYLNYATNSALAILSDEQRYYQEKVEWADELVFVYPLWWGSMPGILKNWIDSVLMTGFAFQYGENGRPKGLLQGRTVRVISTCGTPKFLYCLNGIHRANVNIWKKSIVQFCGMNFKGFHLFGGMDTQGKQVKKMFTSVKKIANK